MSPKKPPRSRQTPPATQGAAPPPQEEERSLVEAPGTGYRPPVIPAEVRHLFQNPDEAVERLGPWESNNLRLIEGETDSDKYAEQLGLRVPADKLEAVLTPEAFEHVKTLLGTPKNIARFRAVEPGECWAARLFQKWRKGYLIEDLVPESNEFPVVEIDDLRQVWMQNYITAPASDDRIVRCSNLVAAGLLPQNFTLLDLLVFVNRGKIPFLPSDDRDWIGWTLNARGAERLEELLDEARGSKKPAAHTPPKKGGHLAEDVGASSWGELHVAWCTSGLRVKKKGAPGEGQLVKWEDMGWTVRNVDEDKRIRLLGRMAAGEGSFEEENSHGVASVRKRVEKDLCRRFGLPGGRKKGPLYYKAGRSYTRFGVFCMARDVLKDAPGKQPFRDEDLADSERTKHDRARRDALYGVDDNEDRM